MAARTPLEPLLAPVASDQPITPESLGWQLLSALPSLPLHTLSLHDDRGEVLWLNEGTLGSSEQSLVEDALQLLGADPEQPGYDTGLDDGRAATVVPVRTPRGDLLGLCLLVTEPTGEALLEQVMGPQLRTILRKLAVIMRPSLPGGYSEPASRETVRQGGRAPQPEPEAYEQEYAQQYEQEQEYAPEEYSTEGYGDGGGYDAADQALDELFGESPVTAAPPEPRRAPPTARPAARVAPPPVTRAAPASPPRARTPPAARAAPPSARPAPRAAPTAAATRAAPTHSTPPASPRAAVSQAGTARQPPPAAPARPPATPGRSAPQSYASSPPTLPAAGAAQRGAPSRPTSSAGAPMLGSATVAPSFPSFPSSGPAAPTRGTAARSAPDPGPCLELLPFVKLRQGVKGRWFEVVPRARLGDAGRSPDSSAVQQLISWLGANRSDWSREPTSFTVNLSITTLEDERFLRDTATALRNQGIQAETVGFEIAEALYTQNRALVERFISTSEKTGCFLVIDDFSFDSAVLPLLRSRAVRMVKIDPKLSGAVQRDRLSEALVTATIHATRVLGVHCATKAVDSPQVLQWLKSAGCELAQGPAVAGPARLDSLGTL